MSEKIHSSSKEYSVDVLPSILGDEGAPTQPIDPKILRRASVKIDLYLIPILGMFREPYLLVSTRSMSQALTCVTFLILRSLVYSSECRCGSSPVNVQTDT
jgi:hypothetical protein